MKIVLIGYPGSQWIVPLSKYLTSKYLQEFDIYYLNYTGNINGWAEYVSGWLSCLDDEEIIFGLDDYLVSDDIDLIKYQEALNEIGGDVVCVKLCKSKPGEHEEYPVTTQYTIWNREYLINLLSKVSTPWEFEITGSRIFDKKSVLCTCIDYYTNSSISGRWKGVNLEGLKEEDLKYIQENGLI